MVQPRQATTHCLRLENVSLNHCHGRELHHCSTIAQEFPGSMTSRGCRLFDLQPRTETIKIALVLVATFRHCTTTTAARTDVPVRLWWMFEQYQVFRKRIAPCQKHYLPYPRIISDVSHVNERTRTRCLLFPAALAVVWAACSCK
jgi:hypothetical protein